MGRSGLYTGLRRRIRKGFLRIAPYGKKEANELTGVCMMVTWAVCSVAVLMILMTNYLVESKVSFLSLSLAIITVIIIQRELPEHMVSRRYERFQKELLQYLSAVKSKYIYTKSVLEAIDSASYNFSVEVQKNAVEIMRIMLSGHRRERVRKYIKNNSKDRYLKLFLIQAHEASENGDSRTFEGESLFCKNIDILRTEIMKGIYERKRKRFIFSGYLFVAIFPVLMIPIVQKTGRALSDELDIFYLGTGNFIVILAYFLLFAVYNVVTDFKGDNVIDYGINLREREYFEVNPESLIGKSAKIRDKINEKQSKELLWLDKLLKDAGQKSSRSILIFRCFIYGIIVFTLGITFILVQQNAEKRALTSRIGNIDEIAVMSSESRKELIEKEMLHIIDGYKKSNLYGSELETEITKAFYEAVPFTSEMIAKSAVQEIVARINIYRGLYLHWYQILVVDVIAILAGLTPIFQLSYRAYRRQEGITSEVKRLQTVIIMERGLAHIGTCELLENMEMFADVFRDNIEDALNLYQSGAENALSILRDEGGKKSYEFKEMAEDFMSISDVGVYEAFSSIEADRRGLEIMTELSDEIMTTGKKNLLDVFSWLPGIIVMLGYLIIPFLRISLADLSEVFTMMDEIQMF